MLGKELESLLRGALNTRPSTLVCPPSPTRHAHQTLYPCTGDVFARAGAQPCPQVVVASSSHLVCTAPITVVGAYPVTVSLNGQNSTRGPTVHRLCSEGQFALPGALCGACPQVWCCTHNPLPSPLPPLT
jgi:hypothetical protein